MLATLLRRTLQIDAGRRWGGIYPSDQLASLEWRTHSLSNFTAPATHFVGSAHAFNLCPHSSRGPPALSACPQGTLGVFRGIQDDVSVEWWMTDSGRAEGRIPCHHLLINLVHSVNIANAVLEPRTMVGDRRQSADLSCAARAGLRCRISIPESCRRVTPIPHLPTCQWNSRASLLPYTSNARRTRATPRAA
jgi:hypothetical protein